MVTIHTFDDFDPEDSLTDDTTTCACCGTGLAPGHYSGAIYDDNGYRHAHIMQVKSRDVPLFCEPCYKSLYNLSHTDHGTVLLGDRNE